MRHVLDIDLESTSKETHQFKRLMCWASLFITLFLLFNSFAFHANMYYYITM